jgi:hypothetical protein
VESVDSFSHQLAIGQPETKNSTSDSPSAFEALDRASNVIKIDFSVSRKAHASQSRKFLSSLNGRVVQSLQPFDDNIEKLF